MAMKRNRLIYLLLSMIIALFLSTAEAYAFLLTVNPTNGGDVTSLPQGIDCGDACSANFQDFSAVQLTATAFPGYGFVNWSGDCLGTGRTITVFMNRTKTCTANFFPCDISFTPSDRIIPETGGDYTVSVSTTPFNCSWDAYADYSWIEITSGASGSGAGLIRYTVDPNTADRIRQGYISISGAETSFLLSQEGPGSGYFQNPNTGTDSYGHIYKRYDMLMNWQDAETFCEGRGGYLTTITDDSEQSFVFNTFMSGAGTEDFRQCWLGGFQPPAPVEPYPWMDWQWVTGEPWSYAHWCNQTPCYEPNDPTGEQDSVAMFGDGFFDGFVDGRWHDANGILLKSFLCEWTNLQYLLTVSKTGAGSGIVSSSESPSPFIDCCSGACEPVCSALYSPNTQVILNAINDADSVFSGWSGACTGAGPCYVSMNNDKDVTAMFNLRQYTVSTQASQGGGISPQSALVVHGDSAQFNITVNRGFSIASAAGCGGSLDGLTYYTGPITANCTVTVNFTSTTHIVSTEVIPQAGGSVTPSSATVNHNATSQFAVSAASGYHIVSVTGCGGTLSENTYTTGQITSDCTVQASFAINTYTVTSSAGAGGSISPSGATTINQGGKPVLTVTPDPGYHIAGVNGTCGGSLNGNTYTTNPVTANCTVQASFAINTYTVTSSAGAGGSISPSGAATVNHGGKPVFTVTPNQGYHITGVNGTCGGSLNGNTYTVNPVTGNCTVQASFAIDPYTVNASAGAGGSISPSGTTTVAHGGTLAFTVTPNPGYHITGVNGTCGGSLNGNTYTTNPVTGNCTVQAGFAINEYTVSASAGPGGGISPAGVTVQHGQTAQFTITPDPGYHLLSAGGCDGTLSQSSLKVAAKKKKKGNVKALSSTIYTTGQITENCTITATFEINAYIVNAEAGEGGSINPSNATVPHGNSAQFTVTPDTGYHVQAVTGCGGSLTEGIYTTGAVTESCTVSASFGIDEYTVSTAAGQGGGIAPASAQVAYGNTAQFAITPDTGHHILSVGGCEGAVLEKALKATVKKKKKNKKTQALTGSTYTTGPITGACTVTASFEIDSYTVTADAGPGGSIDPSGGTTVNYGATPAFTATPNQGYHIKSVNGTCGGALNGSTYTTNPVTENCTVHAEFQINEYMVSTAAGQGGGIAPASAKANHGQIVQFTVTPDTAYHIVLVTGCGGILNGNTYTTGQITEDCTVSSSFAANTYGVTIVKSGNGSGAIIAQGLACEGNTCSGEYAHGTKIIFKVEPEAGFRVADVRIDGVSVGAMNTFTFKKLTGNHTIEIIFAPL
jgi:hypothetical protein